MAISLVDSDALAAANGAGVTLSFTAAEGDVVLLVGGHGNVAAAAGPSDLAYNTLASTVSGFHSCGVWAKLMGPVPDVNVACRGGAAGAYACAYAVYVLRGAELAGLVVQATVNSADPAAATTTVADSWVIVGSSVHDQTTTDPGVITGYATAVKADANDTERRLVGLTHKVVPAPGTEDPGAWSLLGANDTVSYTVVASPPAAPASGPYLAEWDGAQLIQLAVVEWDGAGLAPLEPLITS